MAELLAMGWDAVLFGHIHKPQVLNEKPFVGYAGNLLCKDFGEEQNSQGCWILDLDTGKAVWREVPACRFVTIEWPETRLVELMAGGKEAFRAELSKIDVAEAIVRVRYPCTAEQAANVDTRLIRALLLENGAEAVAGIYPEIQRSERPRDKTMTASLDPLEALRKYLGTRTDVSEALRERAITWAQTLYARVRGA
jgi:exonuclease SbcC